MNSETRQCQNCKTNFTIEPDDFGFYEKIKVPPPTHCPQCRLKRRMIFRNFKTLYKRNSDKSGAPMISVYAPDSRYKVYSKDEWWSDDFDARMFGRDYDFNRPFFEQFKELLLAVPCANVMNVQSENCQYSNMVWRSKNCYLIFGCVEDEDCAYGHIVWESRDCFDNLYVHRSELCYECVDCLFSYKLLYSQECESCAESIGFFDCRSCTNCIGCVGLKQKSYYIFNEHVGKEGYENFLKEHPISDLATISYIFAKQRELKKQVPQRHFFGSHNNNVSGNHIYNAKNVHFFFDVKQGENAKFVFTGGKIMDAYDIAFNGGGIELAYEVLTSSGRGVYFSHVAWNASEAYYSDNCYNSRNIFGCAGLKNAEYSILNKAHSKEDYHALMAKIIEHMKSAGEWGQFFPRELSPFAYNESIINEYYPLKREDALAQGYRWSDNLPGTSGKETIEYYALPKTPKHFPTSFSRTF